MLKYWLVLSLAALALARPETYKENEDFQYARSSTDEGSKSGFYEAQRGNVGGNYERAHNMDTVAQGQMSDAVDQVGSQVRDVANSKHGDVYGAAYTSGVYGQRHLDRSNLEGRNFEENAHASSGASRYAHGHSENLQDNTNLNAGSFYGNGYGSNRASGFQSSSSHSSSHLEHAASDHSQYRVVPVKLSIRPLEEVNMGVKAGVAEHSYSQNLQDSRQAGVAEHAYTQHLQDGRHESRNSLGHDNVYVKPSSGANYEKHHEYKYEKNWERHSEVTPVPLSILPSNVELVNNNEHYANYRQSQNEARNSENRHSVNLNHGSYHNTAVNENGYDSAYRSGYQRVAEPINNRYVVLSPTPQYTISESKKGSNSHHESEYNAGSRLENYNSYGGQSSAHGHLATSADNLSAATGHNHDAFAALNSNADSTINVEPKKYHSSYAYHKSWERQGDPYVIYPSSSDVRNVESEKLQSHNHGYAKNSHYANYEKQDDCEDEHPRNRRSYDISNPVHEQSEIQATHIQSFNNHDALVSHQTGDYVPLSEKQEYETTTPERDNKNEAEDFGNQYEFGAHAEESPPDNEELAPHYEDYNNGGHAEQLTENL